MKGIKYVQIFQAFTDFLDALLTKIWERKEKTTHFLSGQKTCRDITQTTNIYSQCASKKKLHLISNYRNINQDYKEIPFFIHLICKNQQVWQ